jgi:hypothetical protein
MDKAEKFRRRAAEAQELADKARNIRDRAAWLRIAQSWLELIGRKETPADTFQNEADAKGTHQEPSTSSH